MSYNHQTGIIVESHTFMKHPEIGVRNWGKTVERCENRIKLCGWIWFIQQIKTKQCWFVYTVHIIPFKDKK